jgi:hypothetical protein
MDKIKEEELQALLNAQAFQYLKLVEALRYRGGMSTVALRKMGFFSPAVLVYLARKNGYLIDSMV